MDALRAGGGAGGAQRDEERQEMLGARMGTARMRRLLLPIEQIVEAMMFERFSKSAEWLSRMGVKVADPQGFDETGRRMRKNRLLIFSRWCQVMLRFEKAMYADPDRDLNGLWWDLVEKYQGVRRPEGRNAPDYASKIHVVNAPCYYHNYMMGQLFASQVHHAIAREVCKGADPETVIYAGNKDPSKSAIRTLTIKK